MSTAQRPMARPRRLRAWRRPNVGFGPRLLVTLTLSLGLVAVACLPFLERAIHSNAVAEGARLARADARGIEHLVRDADGNAAAIREVTKLLAELMDDPRVVDARLIGPDSRTVAHPHASELGEVEGERAVRDALRLGRSHAGSEPEVGDRSGDLEYVVPVDLPSGRHAYELDQDAAFVDRQVATARMLLLKAMGLVVAGCVLLFYLLGGRRLSRLHRAALNRARADGLTDLGSQRAFHEELSRAVALAARHGEALSIVTLDLDGFKLANDRHGHAHGDELLKGVADVLQRGRAGDRAFRVGGDEFALVLPRTDADGAQRVARRVQRQLHEDVGVRASIGVAQLRPGETDPDALYKQADAAAYQVKRRGGDGVVVFSEMAAGEAAPAKSAALEDLLAEGDLAVVFQPVCDVEDGQHIGYEALARPAERYGFSGPAEAFAAAERLGRVLELDALCVRRTFEQIASLPADALVFVNLSPLTLKGDPDLAAQLSGLASAAGIAPIRVVLEVTERGNVPGATIARAVERLRDAGFQVALDDVGTGNSGLEILRSAVFDFVKIDRSIVVAAVSDTAARAVLLAVDTLARETGAFVIIEGIEDEDVLDFVRRLDDHRGPGLQLRRWGQGYALGRPERVAFDHDRAGEPGGNDPRSSRWHPAGFEPASRT